MIKLFVREALSFLSFMAIGIGGLLGLFCIALLVTSGINATEDGVFSAKLADCAQQAFAERCECMMQLDLSTAKTITMNFKPLTRALEVCGAGMAFETVTPVCSEDF